MNYALPSAAELDASDELSKLKDHFLLPDGCIYLDGNSLGPLTMKARDAARTVTEEQWGNDLIGSWNKHQWIDLPLIVGNKIANLIGASKGEVICCDSVSVNLFKVLSCALKINSPRNKILSVANNFPTDIYIAQGMEKLLGHQNCRLHYTNMSQLETELNEEVAVLLLTHVDFRSGELLNIEAITSQAQAKGILVIWDLAHSAGALPLALNQWNADFAVGCGYKYLHGGPGAPAFIFAARRLHDQLQQPMQGWMGHKTPFSFDTDYEPKNGIEQFLVGTPPILSMSVLNAALDIFEETSISAIRRKAIQLSRFFRQRLETLGLDTQLTLASPEDDELRGNQLAYSHPQAYSICQALIAEGVIADFRSPDILRLGFSPLFLSYSDVERSIEILGSIMKEKTYLDVKFSAQQKVT